MIDRTMEDKIREEIRAAVEAATDKYGRWLNGGVAVFCERDRDNDGTTIYHYTIEVSVKTGDKDENV